MSSSMPPSAAAATGHVVKKGIFIADDDQHRASHHHSLTDETEELAKGPDGGDIRRRLELAAGEENAPPVPGRELQRPEVGDIVAGIDDARRADGAGKP